MIEDNFNGEPISPLRLQEQNPLEPQPRKPTGSWRSPLGLLLITASAIFIVELLIMSMFVFFPVTGIIAGIIADSSMLVLLLFPALYFFSYRPLISQLRAKENAYAALIRTQLELEQRVAERTADLSQAQQDLCRKYDIATAINSLLSLSPQQIPLEELLQQALDHILSIPWLCFWRKGCIFLVEGSSSRLVMKAQSNLDNDIVNRCATIAFGQCLCGQAALSGQIVFSSVVDERHEILPINMAPHGHYCVPIKTADTLIGVINIYVAPEHKSNQQEEDFLLSAATTLAGIILRRTAEAKLEETKQKLQMAVDETSSVILKISEEKNFSVRYTNPYFAACYTTMQCDKKKNNDCSQCSVFKKFMSDPIYQIGEHFNNMMDILEAKNRDLEQAYGQLKDSHAQILQQEKMASIGQLAAGVAHEVNNPIGFISSNLGTLNKYIVRLKEFIALQDSFIESYISSPVAATPIQLGDKRRQLKIDHIMSDAGKLIDESLEGADRVKSIVMDLKNFCRMDDAEQRPGDINKGLESTINIAWNEIKYKATLNKELGDIPLTLCNLGQLNQVFMNILVNAAQAIEKQGEINVKTWNDGESIFVSISDTGSGIPAEKVNRIFDPFFTTKEVGKGTGLGLSIAYDIIKKHGGHIDVTSEVGKGSTFIVQVPAK